VTSTADRHLSVEDFAGYLRTGVPIEHPIPGTPRMLLFVDPRRGRIGLRGPAARHETNPASDLENLSVHMVHHVGQRMIEIAVTDPMIFTDAYPLLCAIADRVQLDGRTLTDALAETVRRLGHLLRRQESLTTEVEAGLIGELALVLGLVRTVGTTAALLSWRGNAREEHDFGLTGFDVEVKTTSSERRSHWISSLTQLVPTGTRPLWLVSMQITGAGVGGTTVGELVGQLRELYEATGTAADLDRRLRGAGWRDSYAAHTHRHWRMRTAPATFAITADFPRLTPDVLAVAGVETTHVTDVRYRLDLTGRHSDSCPDDLVRTLVRAEQELQ
jgi:putative PD-(D/E)XK family protein DUF4420